MGSVARLQDCGFLKDNFSNFMEYGCWVGRDVQNSSSTTPFWETPGRRMVDGGGGEVGGVILR